MSRIANYTVAEVTTLRQRLDEELRGSSHLQGAAQSLADALYKELEASSVLVRLFGTVPFRHLPDQDKRYVRKLAASRGCADELHDQTTVISLLGSRGKKATWNDRRHSVDHLGIPLVSASFIKTIPMVARLMIGMETGLDWIDKQQTEIVVRSMGHMAQLLHVEDAASGVTNDGYKIVPAQDFVAAHGVRTVLGLGGAYLNRTVIALILFTNERIPQDHAAKFMPVIHSFKTATMNHVMRANFFA